MKHHPIASGLLAANVFLWAVIVAAIPPHFPLYLDVPMFLLLGATAAATIWTNRGAAHG